jgi:predicted Fe-Mo cluster-binding NifX family protein
MEGWQKIFHHTHAGNPPLLPLSVALVSTVTAFFIARKEKEVGNLINSQSLIANANESFLDIFTSLVVFAGIGLAYFRVPYVEGAVIILISLLIFKLGLQNIWTSLLVLLDANLDPELQLIIEEKINRIYGVKGVSEVKIRQAGPFKMVECKIETSPTISLYQAHELADKAEDEIIRENDEIESVFIHVEPSKENVVSAIIPVQDINGLNSKVHGHFGRTPYYVILRLSEGKAEIKDFYYNEFLEESKHIGMKVIKAVVKYKLDLLFAVRVGEISFYMLKDNFVDIYQAEEGISVSELIEKHDLGELPRIKTPTQSIEESQVDKI